MISRPAQDEGRFTSEHESALHRIRIRTVTFSSILGADWVLAETQSRRRLAHGPKPGERK